MQTNNNIKKWLIRGIAVGLLSTSSYFAYRYILQNRLKSQIKRVPDSNPQILTKDSLLLLLKTARTQIHPKILQITRESRDRRTKLDPSDESYRNIVRDGNKRIMACIQRSLEKILRKLHVSQSEFEQSIEHYQEPRVQSKLFELRAIRDPNPPGLTKSEILRILNYFIKILKEMEEVSQIELLDLEISFAACEDKVFFKFGIEKADVETQAQERAEKDEEIREKLRIYRSQIRQKEGLFQGNVNLSNLQIS